MQTATRLARRRGARIAYAASATLLAAVVLLVSCQQKRQATTRRAAAAATRPAVEAGAPIKLLVEKGSEAQAIQYYSKAAEQLGFDAATFVDDHRLQDMLAFCGYDGLSEADVERLPSATLMNFDLLKQQVGDPGKFTAHFGNAPAPDDPVRDLVSIRYFAPKIVNVLKVGDPDAKFGWRKIVRFKVREGSRAKQANASALFLLFNHFAPAANDPFDYDTSPSVNNQAILIRTLPAGSAETPLFFFVYNGTKKAGDPAFVPGKLGLALNAAFDTAFDDQNQDYYVPHACSDCHGGQRNPGPNGTLFTRAKLNYVDTDHYFDRLSDDMRPVADSPHGVIYDAKKSDPTQLPAAFAAIRRINQEIRDQNALAASDSSKFQLRAVDTWLQLHANGDTAHKPPLQRPLIPLQPGDLAWGGAKGPDETLTDAETTELLAKLNQYCFRCHSSIRYHVQDKKMVHARVTSMIENMEIGDMPQDRKLTQAERERLTELLRKLNPNP